MSSTVTSSGIASDTDYSLHITGDKENQLKLKKNNLIFELINEDLINTDFHMKTLKSIPDNTKYLYGNHHKTQIRSPSTTNRSNSKKNPYDDDMPSSITEDWDEECKMIEPYHFPSYIRRAQWPNHWRWTPPLGIRRTFTQQLHRNLGFEPCGLFDDIDSLKMNINLRHFAFNF